MANLRISKEFMSLLKNKKKKGESLERVILNNMHPIDKKLKKIFDSQDARRKSKFKKK